MKINLTYALNINQLSDSKDKTNHSSKNFNNNNNPNNKIDRQSLLDYYKVMSYYGLAAKNIYNSGLFIVKNILSCYEYDRENKNYKLKPDLQLHENQKEILKTVNLAISLVNKKRIDRFNINKLKEIERLKKLEESNKKELKILNKTELKDIKSKTPKDNPILFSLYESVISKNTYYQTINDVLLETAIKLKEKHNPDYQDYSTIHSHLTQSTIQRVCNNYRNYLKAMSAYSKTKNNNFTGKPQEPNYLNKQRRITFELAAQRFSNQGKILNILKKHKLYTDFKKTIPVNKSLINNFNNIDLLTLIKQDISNKINKSNTHRIPNNYKLASVRVVPGKYQDLPKIEYVITYEITLSGEYPILNKISQEKYKKDLLLLKDNIKLKLIKEYYKDKETPYFASIDCGMVNFAAVGFYDQDRSKGLVISAKTFYKHVSKINKKIDNRRKVLMTKEIRQIQSKIDTDVKITSSEKKLLKQFYISISQDKFLLGFHEENANRTKNFIHNLSAKIIDDCLRKDVKIIVCGKNKGWKDESDLGKKGNRKFHALPHAQFINYLKYKAVLADILVIETEESYTSETSFVDNEPLKVHCKYKDPQIMETTQNSVNIKTTLFTGERLVINIVEPFNYADPLVGIREKTIFITRNGRLIHADINGSFNIARKVFDKFNYKKYSDKINMDYFLVEVKLTTKTGFKCFAHRTVSL